MFKTLIICILVVTSSFTKTIDRFAWSSTRTLQWEDFKGSPGTLKNWAASSSTGITQSYGMLGNGMLDTRDIAITAHFYPEFSWVRQDKESAYLLAHEQTHFDITEIYARKLRQLIDHYHFTENGVEEIKELYNRVEQQRVTIQNLYDKETNHSLNHEVEVQWKLKVAQWLEGKE